MIPNRLYLNPYIPLLLSLTLVGVLIAGIVISAIDPSWVLSWVLIIGGALGVGLATLLVGRIDQIFLLLVLLIPIQVIVLPLGLNIQGSYLIVVLLLLRIVLSKQMRLIKRTPLTMAIAFFILSAVLSIAWSVIFPKPEVTLDASVYGLRATMLRPFLQFVKIVIPISLAFVVPTVMRRYPRLLDISIKAMLFVMTMASIYGIYQFFAQQNGWILQDLGTGLNTNFTLGAEWRANFAIPRPRSFFFEPTYFGIALVIHIWIIVATLGSQEIEVPQKWLIASLLLALVALFMTTSRGAYICLALTSGLFALDLLIKGRIKLLYLILSITIITILGITIYYLIPGVLDAALLRMNDLDAAITSRKDRYIVSVLQIAADSYFLGVGLGQLYYYEAALFGRPGGGSPMWVYILAEQGIMGLLALFAIFVSLFFMVVSLLKSPYRNLVMGIALALVASLIHYSFSNGSFGTLEWFWIGVIVHLHKTRALKTAKFRELLNENRP